MIKKATHYGLLFLNQDGWTPSRRLGAEMPLMIPGVEGKSTPILVQLIGRIQIDKILCRVSTPLTIGKNLLSCELILWDTVDGHLGGWWSNVISASLMIPERSRGGVEYHLGFGWWSNVISASLDDPRAESRGVEATFKKYNQSIPLIPLKIYKWWRIFFDPSFGFIRGIFGKFGMCLE